MISINQEACDGCATCVKVCPHRVIEIKEKKAFLVVEDRCIECGACQLNCEQDAVNVTKGTGCLYVIFKEDILKRPAQSCGC